MSLLDAFIMEFETNGLDELPDKARKADKELNTLSTSTENLEDCTKDLSEATAETSETIKEEGQSAADTKEKVEELTEETKKLGEETAKTAKTVSKLSSDSGLGGITNFLVNGIKKFSPYILALNLLKNSFSNLQKAMDLDIPISKDTVNTLKDFEMVMRDIRSGTVQIGAGIAELVIPVMNKLAKVVRNVLGFFKEHETFIKVAFIATIITLGVKIIQMIAGLRAVIAPIAAPILLISALIAGLALIIEDLIVWVNGGESAFADLWNEIFGGVEGAKKLFNDLTATIKELWQVAQPIFKGLVELILKGVYVALQGVVKVLAAVAKGIKALRDKNVDINVNKTENIDGSHAEGLDYVPYNGYIAELHRGERVQTAQEANDWRSGLIAAKNAINFTNNYPLNAIPTGAISNAYNNYSNSSKPVVNISGVTIQTQATDAQGIAQDFSVYIKQAMMNLDDGMLA